MFVNGLLAMVLGFVTMVSKQRDIKTFKRRRGSGE